MPLELLVLLVAVPVALMMLRFTTPLLPSRWAEPIGRTDLLLLALGAVGLVFHCTAMFFPEQTALVPLTGGAIDAVNRLGPASVLLYAVPAGLVVVALRRIRWPALAVVAATLVAVGVTMYAGSPLDVHLATIALAVLAISMAAAAFTSGADRSREAASVTP